ncbi:BhlA/UviB family holin-like peptide [Heyndrickxia sporothermodurans]|uniref:BhlA/UviB family holin-like peptide n=1 Tax=Heyndrickxia sporothermodurans TaxID=46224 RepID=UPI00399C80C2
MSAELLIQLVTTVGVLPALFIWLLMRTMNESKARETRLMDHLDRSNVNLEKIAHTLERLDERVTDIERQIDAE